MNPQIKREGETIRFDEGLANFRNPTKKQIFDEIMRDAREETPDPVSRTTEEFKAAAIAIVSDYEVHEGHVSLDELCYSTLESLGYDLSVVRAAPKWHS